MPRLGCVDRHSEGDFAETIEPSRPNPVCGPENVDPRRFLADFPQLLPQPTALFAAGFKASYPNTEVTTHRTHLLPTALVLNLQFLSTNLERLGRHFGQGRKCLGSLFHILSPHRRTPGIRRAPGNNIQRREPRSVPFLGWVAAKT